MTMKIIDQKNKARRAAYAAKKASTTTTNKGDAERIESQHNIIASQAREYARIAKVNGDMAKQIKDIEAKNQRQINMIRSLRKQLKQAKEG